MAMGSAVQIQYGPGHRRGTRGTSLRKLASRSIEDEPYDGFIRRGLASKLAETQIAADHASDDYENTGKVPVPPVPPRRCLLCDVMN
jgi:hypothetical protein